jgi:hypothetical protein
VIKEYNNVHLNDVFQRLRDVGNLFVVRPENLKTVIEEGATYRLDVFSYLKMRSDYKTAKIDRLLERHRLKDK